MGTLQKIVLGVKILAAEAAIHFVLIREEQDLERYKQLCHSYALSQPEIIVSHSQYLGPGPCKKLRHSYARSHPELVSSPPLFSDSDVYLYANEKHNFCSPDLRECRESSPSGFPKNLGCSSLTLVLCTYMSPNTKMWLIFFRFIVLH